MQLLAGGSTMKILLLLLFIFAHAAVSQSVTKPVESSIIVQINGIKTQNGEVLLSLFNSPDGFPTHPERAFRWGKAKVAATSIIISFNGLPPGKYAIAAVHDENSNGVMDRNWIGLPAEPYGVSNNATASFGPPKFDDAKFTVSDKRDTIKIEMKP